MPQWPQWPDRLERTVNPSRTRLLPLPQLENYWSMESSEWAAGMMFRSPAALARLYSDLIQHGIQTFSSKDGSIKNVISTHRYVLTNRGRNIITALIQASKADTEQLKKLAPENL